MPALIQTPSDTNLLQTNNFSLTFPKLNLTEFFCQEANIPGVSLEAKLQPTSFVPIYRPGDRLSYEPFTMTFIVDEKLQSWLNIYNWMTGIAFPQGFDQYKELKTSSAVSQFSQQPQYTDGILTAFSGTNSPTYSVQFTDMFPISLTEIKFDTKGHADTITATATFRYTYYTLTPA